MRFSKEHESQQVFVCKIDYFTQHLDQGDSIDVIYLDFQKAFDSVPHQRLIQTIFLWSTWKNSTVDIKQ